MTSLALRQDQGMRAAAFVPTPDFKLHDTSNYDESLNSSSFGEPSSAYSGAHL